jgi:predicted metal-binding membrane protein
MMTLFAVGYTTAWMAAGVALVPLSLLCRLTVAGSTLPLLVGIAVALAWQTSPAKQRCLNGCHRRTALAAFRVAANLSAFAFGLSQGAWCVGACWALMVLPLLDGRVHLITMGAVTLLVIAERIESPATPAWGFHLPRKGLRIAAAQLRILLNRSSQPV